MIRKALPIVVMVALLLALPLSPTGMAQDGDKPTIALLRFGPHLSYFLVDQGLLEGMRTAGLVNEAEAEALRSGGNLDGETVDIIWSDASFDFANSTLIVEQAIDAGADVLITYSTPVTLAAVAVTADMDDPPAVLFAAVYDPVAAGIAQDSCLKPAHVTGIESITRYDEIIPLLLLQNPDIKLIGTLYNAAETSGVAGAAQIVAAADDLGIEVEERAVASAADIAIAAESLLDAGVQALLIPADMSTVSALPVLMQIATEYQIPVFHSVANAVVDGATVTAGAAETMLQGRTIASLAKSYLDGSRDLASTGIGAVSSMVVSINLDTAAAQGIAISDALLAAADQFVQDGQTRSALVLNILKSAGLDEAEIDLAMQAIAALQTTGVTKVELPPEVMAILQRGYRASDLTTKMDSLLASLHCSDEMIAEQQAALEAGGG